MKTLSKPLEAPLPPYNYVHNNACYGTTIRQYCNIIGCLMVGWMHLAEPGSLKLHLGLHSLLDSHILRQLLLSFQGLLRLL